MDIPTGSWKMLEEFFGRWEFEDEEFDQYDEKIHRDVVAKLPLEELPAALDDIIGCGCCCSSGATNLRHAVKARIKDILYEHTSAQRPEEW